MGYEEGEQWVISQMQTGYPRFFVQKPITALADLIVQRHGSPANQGAILFPCRGAALRFHDFIKRHSSPADAATITVLDFVTPPGVASLHLASRVFQLSAALYPKRCAKLAKVFWQHTGEGISSRRAEYSKKMIEEGALCLKTAVEDIDLACKGPKRYRRQASSDLNVPRSSALQEVDANGLNRAPDRNEQARFVEERYGRNLNLELADKAKKAIRRRIAGSLTSTIDLPTSLDQPVDLARQPPDPRSSLTLSDIYLYPGGMNAIYSTHRTLLSSSSPKDVAPRQSICFGFPYIDTLKVLEKFNPSGCLFYGRGDASDLDDLASRLKRGERYLALFCEFPSNPLLRSPDLQRIRALADAYDFLVVIDETIGNFLNVHVLPYADVLVSSLTKIFSGDSNVMGGATILNPSSRHYELLREAWGQEFEDTYWPEDAIFMERNSRDFITRIARINANAETIVDTLSANSHVKAVYYPTISDTRAHYDACRTPTGGYGGLLSAVFHSQEDAAAFYDALDLAKGPSLGTNFTLASPFVLLAHYGELEWAENLGVPVALVRFSVGLESEEHLKGVMKKALEALDARYQ